MANILKESQAFLRCWQRAALQSSPDAIPPARDEPIAQIAQGTRNPAQHVCQGRPRPRQLRQQCDDSRGTNEDFLRGAARIANDKNRARPRGRVRRADCGGCEQFRYLRRFGGHKAKPVAAVASQKPAHRAVAKAAMAIEDDQQPVAGLIQFTHTYLDAIAKGRDSIRLVRNRTPSILEPR